MWTRKICLIEMGVGAASVGKAVIGSLGLALCLFKYNLHGLRDQQYTFISDRDKIMWDSVRVSKNSHLQYVITLKL